MKARDLALPMRIAFLALWMTPPALLQASQPLDECPVDRSAKVRVCDIGTCSWIGYCAYLGYGPDASTNPIPFDRIAPAPCVERCDRQNTSTTAREACYEQCGFQPAPFRDTLRLPSWGPCDPRGGKPRSEGDGGPLGRCIGGVTLGVASAITPGDVGPSLGLQFEVLLTDRLAVEFQATRHEIEPAEDRETVELDHLSLHAKLYLSDGRVRPFLRAGIGHVDIDPGGGGTGLHGGGGFDIAVGDRTAIETSVTYRASETTGPDIEVLDWIVGWRFYF
ncbi:MAG: hypothetical protein AAGE94_06395 [Acidobacteriota bacterium]